MGCTDVVKEKSGVTIEDSTMEGMVAQDDQGDYRNNGPAHGLEELVLRLLEARTRMYGYRLIPHDVHRTGRSTLTDTPKESIDDLPALIAVEL